MVYSECCVEDEEERREKKRGEKRRETRDERREREANLVDELLRACTDRYK